MKTIKLGNKEFPIKKPDSIALIFEFVIAWSTSEDAITNARLCAGAIGLYLDHHAILPKYKPIKETPSMYGFKCLDRLLSLKVAGSEIYEEGTKLLTDLAASLPRSKEIEDKKDFFPSAGSEDGNS